MAKAPENPPNMESVMEWFELHSIGGKKAVIEQLQARLDEAIEARRAELEAELADLGGGRNRARRPASAPKAEGDKRSDVKVQYRGPNGEEYSGRGAMPKWAKALGINDKAGLEPYRVKE